MTPLLFAWPLLAALWFDELIVLGPRCKSADCADPARHRIWWPGRDPGAPFCDRHAARLREVAEAMGFALPEQPLYYTTAEDDLVQRVRLLELA